MASNLNDIQQLFVECGAQPYGREAVSQLEHALQCAHLAKLADASDALVAACLLHDLGHLLYEQRGAEMSATQDDVHQYKALPFLRPHLPAAVLEPIKLHVDAKRYLCGTVDGYWDTLSDGSKRSLALQGGPFTANEAAAFIAQPHAAEAVQLRRWDDLSKDPARVVPGFEAYRELLVRVSLAQPQPSAAT